MRPILVLVILLLLANVVSAIALVDARQESRRAFVSLSKLEKERDELNIEYGQLQLEHSTWSDAHQIQQLAVSNLGMNIPTPETTVVLRR